MSGAPLALAAIQEAILARLRGDAPLLAIVAKRIVSRIPPGCRFPLVEVGLPVQIPWNTYGPDGRGANVTIQVKAISDLAHDGELHAIVQRVQALFDDPPTPLQVWGYQTAACSIDTLGPPYGEPVGGGEIRHLPVIVRVIVHES